MKLSKSIRLTVCGILLGTLIPAIGLANATSTIQEIREFKATLEETTPGELVKLDVTRLPNDLKEIALDAKEKLPWNLIQQLPPVEKRMIADRNIYLAGFLLPTLPIDSRAYDLAVREGRLTPRGYNDRVIETIEIRPGGTTRTVEFSRGAGSDTQPFVNIRAGNTMSLTPCGNYYAFSIRGSGMDIPPGPERPDLDEVIEIEIEPEPVEETRSGLNSDRNRYPTRGVAWNGGNIKRPIPPNDKPDDDTELGEEGGSPEYATGRIPSGVPGRGHGSLPGRSHRGGTGR